jgi:single-stranded-DNA-specific exonuclease
MTSKQWKIKETDESVVKDLVSQLTLPLPLVRVLAMRGFKDAKETEDFINPRLANLSDPFELPAMEMASERLWKAIDAEEIITVFGDYDVDGVTSAALLTRILTELGAHVKPFIPDRLDEGYGLSQDALERCLEEHGSSVVVTVDCGTNSVESVAYAQSNKVDVIITDHHEPEGETANAFALINPKLGRIEQHENLCGAGVAFKLAHALVKTGRYLKKPAAASINLKNYLDIAALGTVADMVPLVGENRIIVRHGLAQLGKSNWVGMEELKRVAGVKGEPDTYHLGFQLGPRINAAGRIGQPMKALQLLVTDVVSEARNIAQLLDQNNLERREIERKMADEAFAKIDAYFDPKKHYGLVVAREGWHPGVVGIVASRVSRHYNRPAIVMGIEEEGHARGSCRSIEGYNMLDGLQACEKHLSKFGGHMMAAGLEVKSGSLETFKDDFNAAVCSALSDIDLSPVQHIDSILTGDELGWGFLEQLKHLRPFGQSNPEPVWALLNVGVSGTPRVVGQKHLKLALAVDGHQFDAIAFNYSLSDLPEGNMDVAFTLKENHWNGNTTLQLQVQDIRPAGNL